MELEVKLDPAEPEVRMVIHAPARTAEVEALLALLAAEEDGRLLGYRGTETVFLDPAEILRFYGEDKEVFAQTEAGVYTVRTRLYELEERLRGRRFVRVSHSEIVNLRRVAALDLGLTGTIRMTLTGGVTVYVSRRYVKKIKEVLGV